MRPGRRWSRWIFGAAVVGGLIVAVLRASEARAFGRLAAQAQPGWLVLALGLQASTYLAQGEVLGCVTRAGRFPLRIATLYELSLAKLFMEQAVPSAGLSGTFLVASFLQERGIPRPIVAAAVVVDLVSCYAAYAACLGAALLSATFHGKATALVVWASSAFILFGIAFSAAILLLSGRRIGAGGLRRIRALAHALEFLEHADLRLARRPALLLEASLWQVAIVVIDSATVWTLLRALGAHARPSGVFASFMVSTVFRIIGVLPGGLGMFEASSVLTLKMIGVTLPVALSATLLFRGLSFWLPMLPGLWFARRAVRA